MKGWIKLHRTLLDHWLWRSDEPFDKRSAWIDLIFLANHSDGKELTQGKLVNRERGKIYCSQLWLAERWGWERRKVRRFLDVLAKDGMISVSSHIGGTTNGTTITIEKYGFYQSVDATDGTTDSTTHGTTDGTTHGTHKKNVKNIKNNKDIYIGLPDALIASLSDFEKMRKSIKKPMTDEARKLLLNNLNKLAGNDTDLKIKIIEQSIFHSWAGVYELQEDNRRNVRPNYRADDEHSRQASKANGGSRSAPRIVGAKLPPLAPGMERDD